MSAGYGSLTEKEKQTLRLVVRGHDAKSMARQLGLSVHTINERLRDARRKLEVSSSREAARLLFDAEGGDPQNAADNQIGDAGPARGRQAGGTPVPVRSPWRSIGVVAGVALMSIVLGAIALSLLSLGTAPTAAVPAPTAGEAPASLVGRETAAARSARDWLVLGDQGRWKDAWLGTASSFRKQNTVEQWAAAAQQVRPPLGALVSRVLLSQESVPAPPAGVEVVKFRSSFANRANVIEKVSLVREGADWKVAGIYVD